MSSIPSSADRLPVELWISIFLDIFHQSLLDHTFSGEGRFNDYISTRHDALDPKQLKAKSERTRVALVCRQWRAIVDSLRPKTIDVADAKVQTLDNIESNSILLVPQKSRDRSEHDKIRSFLVGGSPSVTAIIFGRCAAPWDNQEAVYQVNTFPNLQSLRISWINDYDFIDNPMAKIVGCFPNLTQLELTGIELPYTQPIDRDKQILLPRLETLYFVYPMEPGPASNLKSWTFPQLRNLCIEAKRRAPDAVSLTAAISHFTQKVVNLRIIGLGLWFNSPPDIRLLAPNVEELAVDYSVTWSEPPPSLKLLIINGYWTQSMLLNLITSLSLPKTIISPLNIRVEVSSWGELALAHTEPELTTLRKGLDGTVVLTNQKGVALEPIVE